MDFSFVFFSPTKQTRAAHKHLQLQRRRRLSTSTLATATGNTEICLAAERGDAAEVARLLELQAYFWFFFIKKMLFFD